MSIGGFPLKALAAPEAEASIIGCLLMDNRAMDRIGDHLASDDFYNAALGAVYSEMQRQFLAGKPWDVVTMFHALGGQMSLADLQRLAQFVPSSANLRRYVELVREHSRRRAMLETAQQIEQLAIAEDLSIDQRIEQAQAELFKLSAEGIQVDHWVAAADGVEQHAAVLEARAAGKTTAMSTGLRDLDEILEGGLRPGELVVIGARPSMGKTAFGMTIGLNMAREHCVAMLSMEMPHIEVRDRMVAMLGQVSLSSVKRPAKGLDWARVASGFELARALKFFVADQGGLTINQLRSKARNIKRLHGLNVLVVDYIGLMVGLDARQPRAYQVEEISRGLKTLAKELDIAIVCLAQVNRRVDERADATPSLSDLRDSGAIEQDADVVMFLHRPIQTGSHLGEGFKHYAKLNVAKNRNGSCGVLNLHYEGEQTRFEEWNGEPPSAAMGYRPRGGGL